MPEDMKTAPEIIVPDRSIAAVSEFSQTCPPEVTGALHQIWTELH